MILSEEQVDTFFDRGWLVIPDVFSSEEMMQGRQAFDRLRQTCFRFRTTQTDAGAYFVLDETAHGDVIIKRIVWAGGMEPSLLDLSADRRLLGPALQLLGSSQCEQLLCQAHFKMPGDGVSFDWHQDIQHRDKGPGTWRDTNGRGSYVQTIVLVDEMTPENGPLQFIPNDAVRFDGSGRISSGHHDDPTPGSDRQAVSQIDETRAVTVTGGAGSVILFGPYAVNGSTANTSRMSRRILINGYAFPGANGRIYPGEGSGRRLELA